MSRNGPNRYSYLEQLRLSRGTHALRQVFHELAVQDREKAVGHLNNEHLGFPTLFLLMPEIEALDLFGDLSRRNNTALRLCAGKSDRFELCARLDQLLPRDDHAACRALRWVFDTGLHWDGPHALYDSFDAVMDAAAALLIKTYRDTSILPAVCELIFLRNRKGVLIHDLVWSLFQACDRDALDLIARRLLSSHPKDVLLACTLLHLPVPAGGGARQKLYRRYRLWLSRNRPYLRFTGEFFQQTSQPNPVGVDLEAKYLAKPVSPRDGKPLAPLTGEESESLTLFRSASERDRETLATCSAALHARDLRAWRRWLGKPLPEQVDAARTEVQAAQ